MKCQLTLHILVDYSCIPAKYTMLNKQEHRNWNSMSKLTMAQ